VTQGRGYFDEATQQWVNNVYTNTQVYDGDGSLVRYTKARTVNGSPATPDVTYYLRSSVLGGAVVSEYKGGGTWAKSYVFASGK
jgi:hypothetical protein